jgi:hypothetical protein
LILSGVDLLEVVVCSLMSLSYNLYLLALVFPLLMTLLLWKRMKQLGIKQQLELQHALPFII